MASEYIESTPTGVCMDPSIHIRSAWPLPKGKLLTSRAINKRMKEGFYGIAAQQRALSNEIHRRTLKSGNKGIVYRCGCGEALGIKFLRYSYLPKTGWYCQRCLKIHRAERDRQEALSETLKERIERVYA